MSVRYSVLSCVSVIHEHMSHVTHMFTHVTHMSHVTHITHVTHMSVIHSVLSSACLVMCTYRSLLQKSPIKETICRKRDL